MPDPGTAVNKDYQEVESLLVEIVKDLMLAKADGKIDMQDTALLLPIFLKVGPAVDNISHALDNFSVGDLKLSALKLLEAGGIKDAKLHVYVEEGFNIISKFISIYNSYKRIKEAI